MKDLFPVICCVGTAHLSYLLSGINGTRSIGSLHAISAESFLRSAAHEGVLRARIRSELPLCFGSLLAAALILFSLNAGQSWLSNCLLTRIPANVGKVKLSSMDDVSMILACQVDVPIQFFASFHVQAGVQPACFRYL